MVVGIREQVETVLKASGPRRFTVAEYERMHEIGLIAEHERVELVEGRILEMAAIGFRHANTVFLANIVLGSLVAPHGVSVQSPIGLSGDSMPQHDLAVVRREDFSRRRMVASDVLFVVEVADSSKRFDLTVKFPRYAAAGIPEGWLFDLTEDRIQRHSDPGPDGYRQVTSVGRGESLASLVLPSVLIVVDEVLGPPVE